MAAVSLASAQMVAAAPAKAAAVPASVPRPLPSPPRCQARSGGWGLVAVEGLSIAAAETTDPITGQGEGPSGEDPEAAASPPRRQPQASGYARGTIAPRSLPPLP